MLPEMGRSCSTSSCTANGPNRRIHTKAPASIHPMRVSQRQTHRIWTQNKQDPPYRDPTIGPSMYRNSHMWKLLRPHSATFGSQQLTRRLRSMVSSHFFQSPRKNLFFLDIGTDRYIDMDVDIYLSKPTEERHLLLASFVAGLINKFDLIPWRLENKDRISGFCRNFASGRCFLGTQASSFAALSCPVQRTYTMPGLIQGV